MLSGIFNALYELISGKERFVYYSIWSSGKEVGRYMSKREAKRVIKAFELTGFLGKTIQKIWWSDTGAFNLNENYEPVARYNHGVRD